MKIKYLGTGSSEGVPSLFCNCENCIRARKLKGKNLRRRSQMVINQDLLIDFPADTFSNVIQGELDLSMIENILISHSHADHFYAGDLTLKMDGYSFNSSKKLTVYGSMDAKRVFDEAFNFEGRFDKNRIDYQVLEPYVTVPIGDYLVTPVLANHIEDEICYLYIIKDKYGKTIFYGHDTGVLPKATKDFLMKSQLLFDVVSIDGTFYDDKRINGFEVQSHMNLKDVVDFKGFMHKYELINHKTHFYLSHISHHHSLSHDHLSLEVLAYGCEIAHDGLEIYLEKEVKL